MSERYKKILRWLAVVFIVATVTHVGVIFVIPRGMMWIASYVLGNRIGTNSFFHADRPNFENQAVVRSSPDLIYSACAYDVSAHPIRVTAPLTGSYMSLSMYAADTACFFVRNDRQAPKGFDVVVLGPDSPDRKIEGATTVRAPSARGFMLFRNFAGSGAQVKKIEEIRRQAKIETAD